MKAGTRRESGGNLRRRFPARKPRGLCPRRPASPSTRRPPILRWDRVARPLFQPRSCVTSEVRRREANSEEMQRRYQEYGYLTRSPLLENRHRQSTNLLAHRVVDRGRGKEEDEGMKRRREGGGGEERKRKEPLNYNKAFYVKLQR